MNPAAPDAPASPFSMRGHDAPAPAAAWQPSGEVLDLITERVVERLEDRVVEEIERRGRHVRGVF
ncbi:hypothetical protein [Actinotalea sp. K2]|uniref:hypothetical protein n=1 Tax=Actinotalea sp. K2 TaxID=2939438 RepID=UPI002016D4A1|nr:hypothetical protein [Actinotalea sp. K2]MCL3861856.1 hypothetical protein [Actinotalea sp. K2]